MCGKWKRTIVKVWAFPSEFPDEESNDTDDGYDACDNPDYRAGAKAGV